MRIRNEIFKGRPALLLDNVSNVVVSHCTFLDFTGKHGIPIEDLIRADGREPGGSY